MHVRQKEIASLQGDSIYFDRHGTNIFDVAKNERRNDEVESIVPQRGFHHRDIGKVRRPQYSSVRQSGASQPMYRCRLDCVVSPWKDRLTIDPIRIPHLKHSAQELQQAVPPDGAFQALKADLFAFHRTVPTDQMHVDCARFSKWPSALKLKNWITCLSTECSTCEHVVHVVEADNANPLNADSLMERPWRA